MALRTWKPLNSSMSASNSPPTEGTPKVTPLSWMISISAPQLLTKGSTVGPLVQSSEADVRPVNQLSISWRVSWVTCTHSGSQWPGSLRVKSFRGCSSLGLNSACELQSCLHLSCWLHPVACQPWIYLDFLPDCWVTGAEDSVSGILLCWHPLRPRMWSQRKPLIRPNEQLTHKMTLPLLDFLCCCLCTISFLFLLMLVYTQLPMKPASLLQAISLVQLNITQKKRWKIQFVAVNPEFPSFLFFSWKLEYIQPLFLK